MPDMSPGCRPDVVPLSGTCEADAKRRRRTVAVIVPDATFSGMWRVQWPDGRLSDLTNLARVRDAAASFDETVERERRGRHGRDEGGYVRLDGEAVA